jgi:hypothetical protein
LQEPSTVSENIAVKAIDSFKYFFPSRKFIYYINSFLGSIG